MGVMAGLDFGTTTSIFSYMERDEIAPEPFTYGGTTGLGTSYVPSLVAYGRDSIRIGQHARLLSATDASLYRYFKMLLPEEDKSNWSKEYGPYVSEHRTPSELATDYIGELITGYSRCRKALGREAANPLAFQQFTGKEIEGLIVSVPHVWHEVRATGRNQLQAVIGGLGLPLLQLISEPVAAAAYFAHKYRTLNNAPYKGNLLICDMGGGTFDVTLCQMSADRVEVLLNEGNGEKGLGIAGAHFDHKLIEQQMGKRFKELNAKELSEFLTNLDAEKKDADNVAKLMNYVENPDDVNAEIEPVYVISSKTTRDFLNVYFKTIAASFAGVKEGIRQVLTRITTAASERAYPIDRVVLVGGFSKFPLVQDAIGEFFGEKVLGLKRRKTVDIETLNLDEMAYAISFGACLVANEAVEVSEKYEHTIGIIVTNMDGKDEKIELIRAGEPLDKLTATRYCKRDEGDYRRFNSNREEIIKARMFIRPGHSQDGEISRQVSLTDIPNRDLKSNRWLIGARVDLSKVPYLVIRDTERKETKEYPLALLPEFWEVAGTRS